MNLRATQHHAYTWRTTVDVMDAQRLLVRGAAYDKHNDVLRPEIEMNDGKVCHLEDMGRKLKTCT